MSAMPWVSFTSVMHPLQMNPPDSVPRIAWGKVFEERLILKMPLSVQVHHALLDGIHLGRYYSLVQEYLDHPENLFVDRLGLSNVIHSRLPLSTLTSASNRGSQATRASIGKQNLGAKAGDRGFV